MNNENNNDGLNVISLGSVGDSNVTSNNVPLDQIPPVPQDVPEPLNENQGLDNLNMGNPEPNPSEPAPVETPPTVAPEPAVPVEPSVAPVEAVPPVMDNNIPNVPPLTPPPVDVPIPMDNLNTTPFMNEIGTVPPIPNVPDLNPPVNNPEPQPPKKKGGMNKTLFVLIIILALTAVGVGVYIFLHMSNNGFGKTAVTLKEVKIELGGNVSTNIDDYATFKMINKDNCHLDTTSITDTNSLGSEYKYTITCGTNTYEGKATIVDTIAPVVKVKEVTVGVNGEAKPEAFIETCDDKSECSYKFKDEEAVKTNLQAEGTYEVEIIVTDLANNTTEVKASLKVNNTVEELKADLYVNCSKTTESLTELLKLGIVNNAFMKKGIRNYIFKLSSEEYNALKQENATATSLTYKDITGSPKFNDETTTLVLSVNASYDSLVSEAGKDIPEGISELRDFYNSLGYSCSIGY